MKAKPKLESLGNPAEEQKLLGFAPGSRTVGSQSGGSREGQGAVPGRHSCSNTLPAGQPALPWKKRQELQLSAWSALYSALTPHGSGLDGNQGFSTDAQSW